MYIRLEIKIISNFFEILKTQRSKIQIWKQCNGKKIEIFYRVLYWIWYSRSPTHRSKFKELLSKSSNSFSSLSNVCAKLWTFAKIHQKPSKTIKNHQKSSKCDIFSIFMNFFWLQIIFSDRFETGNRISKYKTRFWSGRFEIDRAVIFLSVQIWIFHFKRSFQRSKFWIFKKNPKNYFFRIYLHKIYWRYTTFSTESDTIKYRYYVKFTVLIKSESQ